ncbi:Crp/Fnr family transcriptional regulator [Chitinophaga parva]|uniref:Crp/Fnr family transcriptional regulator n=1 Tax=Chitinophaga parva TaxID=2169414 RepID=UPI001401D9ED|nr:hypothetical protein [Chitinophaga parva]
MSTILPPPSLFFAARPSAINIQALEATKAYRIHHEDLETLYKTGAAAERVGRHVAEHQFIRRSVKELKLLSLTAKERYQHLFEEHPDIVSRIFVKNLSSYLGIHPERLSRIRRQPR